MGKGAVTGEFLGLIPSQQMSVQCSSCRLHNIRMWDLSFTYCLAEEPAMNFRSMCQSDFCRIRLHSSPVQAEGHARRIAVSHRENVETRIHLSSLFRTSTTSFRLPVHFLGVSREEKILSLQKGSISRLFPFSSLLSYNLFGLPSVSIRSSMMTSFTLSAQRHGHTLSHVPPYFQSDILFSQN